MSAPIVTTTTGAAGADQRGFFGHPKGLQTLFFTEMWERFSYYGMRAFLVYYAAALIAEGGLGMSQADAGAVYGIYGASVYLFSLPGGWIADRFLGQRKAVLLGGTLIMLGHLTLAVPSTSTFYGGLALIVYGTGFLKPNVSTMVGQLYSREDARRDSGYTIFYMGINVGAFIAPIACTWLVQSPTFRSFLEARGLDPHFAWHFGFGAAAVGMFFGLVQYVIGWRKLGDAGLRPTVPSDPRKAARDRKALAALLVAMFGVPALVVALHVSGAITLTKDNFNQGFGVFLSILSVALFGVLIKTALDQDERNRVIAMIALFVGCLSFFGVFEQAGSTLNFFALNHTRNEIFGIGFPSGYFQSVNAIFVVLLAPVFAWLWIRLAKMKREPFMVTKFAIGIALVALSFVIMLPTVSAVAAGEKVSPLWLLVLYLLQTAGELCLSPVGLSSMSKLAPPRLAGMVMGMWFLSTAIGYWLAGNAEHVTAEFGLGTLFTVTPIACMVVAAILLAVSVPIRRLLARTPQVPKAVAREH